MDARNRNRKKERGVALLAVLIFAAFALPIVVILLSLTGVQAQFPKAVTSKTTSEYAADAGEESVYWAFFRQFVLNPPKFISRCDPDPNFRRNDQYQPSAPLWYDFTTGRGGVTFGYIGSYWIRDPNLQPADIYDPGVTDPNRAAQSLPIVPLYQMEDSADGDCVPDNLSGDNIARTGLMVYAPFMPYGKKALLTQNVANPLLSDLLWNGSRLDVNQTLTLGNLVTLSRFLNDPGRLPYDFYLAGDTNGNPLNPKNPYERMSMLSPTATPYPNTWMFAPTLPAEGFNTPLRGNVLVDPQTGRPLINSTDNTSLTPPNHYDHIPNELALDVMPTGYEIAITDEGSRFPIYDFFHNPDDGLFHNPYPGTDPDPPFRKVMADLYGAGNAGTYLLPGFNQQIAALAWLASGLGPSPGGRSAGILSWEAYNDNGDQGGPSGSVESPNQRRDDRDGNGIVDEPIRRFPDSIKEIIDVDQMKPTGAPLTNGGIGPDTFNNLKHLVTLYSGLNAQFVTAPQVGAFATQFEPIEDPALLATNPSGFGAKMDLYSPPPLPDTVNCTANTLVTRVQRPQDCIIPDASYLDSEEYKDASAGWESLWDSGDGLIEPETFYAFVQALCDAGENRGGPLRPRPLICSDATRGMDARWIQLNTELLTLFPYGACGPVPVGAFDYCALTPRIIGHWMAWSYFYAYFQNPGDCRDNRLAANAINNVSAAPGSAVLGRYHGIGDMLLPLPPLGPYYDPGNFLALTGCPGNHDTGDFAPRLFVPVDIGTQCGAAPLPSCIGSSPDTPDVQFTPQLNDPYCIDANGPHDYDLYPDCYLRVWGAADPNVNENSLPGYIQNLGLPCGTNAASCGLMMNPVFYVPDQMPTDTFQVWGGGIPIPMPGCQGQGNCQGWGKCPPKGNGNKKGCGQGAPPVVTFNRLNDESILLEVVGEATSASSPFRTYYDSPLDNEVDVNPRFRCENAGLMAAPGSTTTSGVWQEADGRYPGGNPACDVATQNPVIGVVTVPGADWRPLHYRGRINVNTASFPVLEALGAKLLRTPDAVTADPPARARDLALSLLRYREWFYYSSTLPGLPPPLAGVTSGSLWDTRQTSLVGWAPNAGLQFDGIFSTLFAGVGAEPCTSSILTQYMQSLMPTRYDPFGAGDGCQGDPAFPAVTSALAPLQAKLNWPNDKNNPPFRNITQLMDVACEQRSTGADPRDVVNQYRALSLQCPFSASPVTTYTNDPINHDLICIVTGRAIAGCRVGTANTPLPVDTASAQVFARIDQDISVISYGTRIESLGKMGDASAPRFAITTFGLPQEVERAKKDDVSLFTKLY